MASNYLLKDGGWRGIEKGTNGNVGTIFLLDFFTHHRPILRRLVTRYNTADRLSDWKRRQGHHHNGDGMGVARRHTYCAHSTCAHLGLLAKDVRFSLPHFTTKASWRNRQALQVIMVWPCLPLRYTAKKSYYREQQIVDCVNYGGTTSRNGQNTRAWHFGLWTKL